MMKCDNSEFVVCNGSSAYLGLIDPIQKRFLLMNVWIYAVATWWQGRLYVMSDWFGQKGAAKDALEAMGRGGVLHVVHDKAWIYRHLIDSRRLPR